MPSIGDLGGPGPAVDPDPRRIVAAAVIVSRLAIELLLFISVFVHAEEILTLGRQPNFSGWPTWGFLA